MDPKKSPQSELCLIPALQQDECRSGYVIFLLIMYFVREKSKWSLKSSLPYDDFCDDLCPVSGIVPCDFAEREKERGLGREGREGGEEEVRREGGREEEV